MRVLIEVRAEGCPSSYRYDEGKKRVSQLLADLREEYETLFAFVAGLTPRELDRQTVFHGWSVRDQILHLFYVDLYAFASVTNPDRFQTLVAEHRADQARGVELSQRLRERFGHLAKQQVLNLWRDQYLELCDALRSLDPGARTKWFGPDMSVASLMAARQMEVWAHGQDIYDLFVVKRRNGDRIRNICELGVRTYGWSFRNRDIEPPAPAPKVELTGPSGAVWRWNEDREGLVSGSAEDFTLVVTQRRHVDDTGLRVEGEGAAAWMLIAQCFAGPPADGPRPGERAVAYG